MHSVVPIIWAGWLLVYIFSFCYVIINRIINYRQRKHIKSRDFLNGKMSNFVIESVWNDNLQSYKQNAVLKIACERTTETELICFQCKCTPSQNNIIPSCGFSDTNLRMIGMWAQEVAYNILRKQRNFLLKIPENTSFSWCFWLISLFLTIAK